MLSSSGDIAIIVPAYFVCAGILVYTAIVSASVGLTRRRAPIYLAFTATCLAAAVSSASVAGYYLADSVGGAVEAIRWLSDGNVLLLCSLFLFTALYTEAPRMQRKYAIAGIAVLVYLSANHLLPYGIRFSDVVSSGWIFLPWGEGIFHVGGVPSAWNVFFRVIGTTFIAWAVWRLYLQYRAGQRRDALVLAIYLVVLYTTSFQGALIDLGVIKTFHWSPFAFVGFAMLMGINLAFDFMEQNRALRQRALELRDTQERLERAMDAANLALFEVEVATGRVYLSESWAVMLGRESAPTQTTIKDLLEIVHPDERDKLWNLGLEGIKGEAVNYEVEHRVRNAKGEWIWVLSRARVVEHDGNGRVVRMAGTNIDITERKLAEQRIHHLATRDALTNLPNRTMFSNRLTETLGQSPGGFAILSIGLDRFTTINDSLGHKAGDLVLRRMAGRISARAGERGLVARAGGDEFLVLVPKLEQTQEAAAHAASIRDAIAAPLAIDDHNLVITASVGIAIHPDDGNVPGLLLRNADTALHNAKKLGGNMVRFFDESMNRDAHSRFNVEVDLRRGLAKGEFRVHYQPKVEIGSGRIVGYEALVRWQHPEAGLVLPARFIGVAEDTGLILDLGERVLLEACGQAARWPRATPREAKVAVNVTARQFRDSGFTDMLSRTLEITGLDPQLLELEIVENAIMDHAPETLATLRKLGEMGVELAIDDFGTGYSSLGYLRRLPIDTVKIDRSFVADAPTSPEASTIVRAVISLAHGLALKVVAEGVETSAQVDFLKEHGCDQAQGYYYGRPVPPEELVFGSSMARS